MAVRRILQEKTTTPNDSTPTKPQRWYVLSVFLHSLLFSICRPYIIWNDAENQPLSHALKGHQNAAFAFHIPMAQTQVESSTTSIASQLDMKGEWL